MSTPSENVDIVVDYKKGISNVFSMFGHKWNLKAIPDNGDPFRLLGVFLILSDGNHLNKGSLSLTVNISLSKKEGIEGVAKSQTFVFTSAVLELGFDDFAVVDEKFDAKYVKDNNLVFHINAEKEKPLPQMKKIAPVIVTSAHSSNESSVCLVHPSGIQDHSIYSSTSPTHRGGSPTHTGRFSPILPQSPISRPSSARPSSATRPLSATGGASPRSRPSSPARFTSTASPRPISPSHPMYTVPSSGSSCTTKEVSLSGTLSGTIKSGSVGPAKSTSPIGNKVILPSLTGK